MLQSLNILILTVMLRHLQSNISVVTSYIASRKIASRSTKAGRAFKEIAIEIELARLRLT